MNTNNNHIEWGDECLGADVKQKQAQERTERIRCHNVSSGMVQCSGCGCWFYDEPGNFCSFCADGGAP